MQPSTLPRLRKDYVRACRLVSFFAGLQRLDQVYIMQHAGRICITADGNLEPLVLTVAFHKRELSMVGSSDGWDYQQHASWYFHEIQQHSTPLEQLFEQENTQRELISLFEGLAMGRSRPVKVLVHYEL